MVDGNTTLTGAYCTDPIGMLADIIAHSKYLCVGGDCGGRITKLGLTHTDIKGKTGWLPFVLYDGPELYESFAALNGPVLKFKGATAKKGLKSIFAVFKWLISKHNACLNGDMKFQCMVLGHDTASARYPCPICLTRQHQYSTNFQLRTSTTKGTMDASHSISQTPLIRVRATHIVPPVLHIYLGMGEIVTKDILPKLATQEIADNVITCLKIKSIKDREGGGGKADVYKLNGPELRKYGKSEFPFIVAHAMNEMGYDTKTVKEVEDKLHTLKSWIMKLDRLLLTTGELSDGHITELQQLADDIHKQLPEDMGRNITPKMHMLYHCVQFAKNHRALGNCAESQMESMHASMNRDLVRLRNLIRHPAEQLRCVLADTVERHIKNYPLPVNEQE